MFKKKQTPPGRSVRSQASAPVFSYYANRSSSDTTGARRQKPIKTPRQKRFGQLWSRNTIHLVPSILAGGVLVVCILYNSSLSGQPKLQIVASEQAKLALAEPHTYEQHIAGIFGKKLQNNSKLLIDTDSVASEIEGEIPELGKITIMLPLVGRRPVVQAEPLSAALLLTSVDKVYAVDQSGRVTTSANELPSSLRDKLPVVQDESGLALEPGQYGLKRETVSFIEMVTFQLKAANIAVQSLILSNTPDELHVRTNDNYYIKFNMRGDGRAQAGTFIATQKQLRRQNVQPKQYIDVRVPGKVYYK